MSTVYTILELPKGGHDFCASTNRGLDQGVETSTPLPMWSSPDVDHRQNRLQREASLERGCHLHSLGAHLWWACHLLLANMERTKSWAPSTPPMTMLEASSSTSSIMRNAATSTCRHHLHRCHTRRGRRLHQHVAIRLHRHGVAIVINSSSSKGVVYIDADGCPHDVVIFFDLLLGKDTDFTDTSPFFYTERRSSP